MLRRTHSAGCSKDVPSYALFLKDEKAMRVSGSFTFLFQFSLTINDVLLTLTVNICTANFSFLLLLSIVLLFEVKG